jgi:hypothetical protein
MMQRIKQKPLLRRQRGFLIYSIFGCLFVSLLISCQNQTGEERFLRSGALQPRNHRKKVIFDYFQALKEQRYQDAYELRTDFPLKSKSYQIFMEDCRGNSDEMPSSISIGREKKQTDSGEACGYHYIVYILTQNGQFQGGEVSLHENPKQPGSCQVGYNSAFGIP